MAYHKRNLDDEIKAANRHYWYQQQKDLLDRNTCLPISKYCDQNVCINKSGAKSTRLGITDVMQDKTVANPFGYLIFSKLAII